MGMRPLPPIIKYNSTTQDALLVTLRLIAKIKEAGAKPICAKCKRIVDSFDLDIADTNDCFFHFVARCHGNSQSFSVHKGYFMAAQFIGIGEAFADEETHKTIDFQEGLIDGLTHNQN